MAFNPFVEIGKEKTKLFDNWTKLYPISYDKNEVDPYTKTRVILMNGAEFEANWFLHQFSRHCPDNDLRREIALVRRNEQQQQKRIACIKPIEESILETTISYEQLAVDLTARLAQMEKNMHVKAAMDLALLEDFDHLYRYANLLEYDMGIHAEKLVGRYTEIMPGRPTIAEHRHPNDDIRYYTDFEKAEPITKLNINIITAAEQQTMNYYMNVAGFYQNDLGRQLYQEIGMIEEQHVSSYGSLLDTKCTWLEEWLMHEYTECYLYYSAIQSECDAKIKKIWQAHLEDELTHLQLVSGLIEKYEGRCWQEIFTNGGEFPELLVLGPNIEYVREVLANTVRNTAKKEDVVALDSLPSNYEYFDYQKSVNTPKTSVASHRIITNYIDANGMDYRFEVEEHPIECMQNREKDNTEIGRVQGK